jgi:hypothetical protein
VVAAVSRGIQAETSGDAETARKAYAEAWDAATDDFERCIAAHYVPRLIDDSREKLRWNEDALRFALAVGDERVRGFLASLHACVGQARLGVGDITGAREALRTAQSCLADVPEGPYKTGLTGMIERGIAAAGS